MAGIFISMFILVLVFFITTRVVWLNIIKDEKLRVELHLPIIAVYLTKSDKNNKNSKKKKRAFTSINYRRIGSLISYAIEKSEIIIKQISFPKKNEEFKRTSFTRPYRNQSAFFALHAYLNSKAEKLTVYDNAIVLSGDNSELLYNFTVKFRLYHLIYLCLSLLIGGIKDKITKG